MEKNMSHGRDAKDYPLGWATVNHLEDSSAFTKGRRFRYEGRKKCENPHHSDFVRAEFNDGYDHQEKMGGNRPIKRKRGYYPF
jgi:hypothetical protein